MAYFDCIVGGSGGKWKLTVACTSDFAGLTITCTDGTTTLTKTCPSASPYTVVFNIPNGGTWTISGTASGQTGTTTVIIPDSAILNPPIPTGSTVTPVNDIQIWLHCANIWDKTYTTINQVLADPSTLLALISSNNAADYMARSTNWASSVCANQTAMVYIGNNNYCANKLLANSTWLNAICNSTYFESVLNVKVPTMTSNTAPSGECFGTSINESPYTWYYAFDGNDNSPCKLNFSGTATLGYKFTQNAKIYKIAIKSLTNDTSAIKNFKIQSSSDGNTWNDATTSLTYDATVGGLQYFIITNLATVKQWRALITSNHGYSNCFVYTLQFYGRA